MKTPLISRKAFLPVAVTTLFGLPSLLPAQKIWQGESGTGGDGSWGVSENWVGGLPDTTANGTAQFQLDATYTTATSVISVGAGATTFRNYSVGAGKTVVLNLSAGTALDARGAIGIVGTQLGTGSGAASLTFSGPDSGAASAVFTSFYVGHNGGNGNQLTFSGPIVVTDAGTSFSMVGHGGGVGASSLNNRLRIEAGASLARYGLHVGRATNSPSGNGIEIDGANSVLTVNGGGATVNNTRLQIGSVVGGAENFLSIRNGGKAVVTTGVGGSATNALLVGVGSGARSNSVSVRGEGSRLELLLGTTLTVGAGTDFGGNALEVAEGGTVIASGEVTLSGHAENGGNNDGANRLQILAGGTFTSSSTITNHGLVQLQAGGVLDGSSSLTVASGGRFEAAGSGLGTSVSTVLQDGGVMAVGLTGVSAPAVLTLHSEVTFETGSVLEMKLFAGGTSDQISLGLDASLDLSASGVGLRLLADGETLEMNDRWTLFTGETAGGILGAFAPEAVWLPVLSEGLDWDLSGFNEAGGWQVAVIPEPGSVSLLLTVLGAAVAGIRRKRTN